MSRPRSGQAQDISAIDARYEARRAEIEREHSEFADGIRRFEAAVAGGEASRAATERAWRKRYPGMRVMTLPEAAAKRRDLLREAEDAYRRELETFEIAARVRGGADTLELNAWEGERGPFQAELLRTAIEMRKGGASYDTMAAEIDGLSKRQARNIGLAMQKKRLRITRSGIQGFTRREGDRYFIPALPDSLR